MRKLASTVILHNPFVNFVPFVVFFPSQNQKELRVMNYNVASLQPVPLGLGRLRELAGIVRAIRGLVEPITSPEGLRKAIDLVVRLARLLGVDASLLDRLQSILDDESLLRMVLAILQYVSGIAGGAEERGALRVALADTRQVVRVEAAALVDWLPLVIALLNLLREIRGER